MLPTESMRVGYVVKRYPRYSETFIVNEILAHEAAGLSLEILSLRAPCDTHFQDRIARVRAPVRCLAIDSTKSTFFWEAMQRAAQVCPQVWRELSAGAAEDVLTIHQALLVATTVREQGLEHLHAHFATEAASVARIAARMAGVTYSFTAHAKDIYHENASFTDLRRKLVEAAAVITVSEYNLRYLRETFGAAAAGVQRIYNGLELDDFVYRAPQQRPPIIIAVGRLVEKKKGFADLIRACRLLRDQELDFRCRIIGTGELEQHLRLLIHDQGLTQHVEMLGPRPQIEVIRLVQEAAVLAAPCVIGEDGNRDGLPTVLLEAMALGTPCVSTAVTGIPELVRDQQTGLIVPEHDPMTLAQALQRLLNDSLLRTRLATAARRCIEENFDVHRNASYIRTLFRAAIDDNNRSRRLAHFESHPAACTPEILQETG